MHVQFCPMEQLLCYACRCVCVHVCVLHFEGVKGTCMCGGNPLSPSTPGNQGSAGRELRANPPLQPGGHGSGPTAVHGRTECSLSRTHWERELLHRSAREAKSWSGGGREGV